MEKLSTEPYKGVRDFYPRDMALMKHIFGAWRSASEAYGYEQYDASVMEPTEMYLSKTSEEIVREQTYTFIDRGDRSVTLRPEMTPTVSRMVAGKYRETPMPARLFSMPNLFRYERPQKGRLREFYQLNVDIFGVESLDAEVELILVAKRIMDNLDIPSDTYVFKLNSRASMRAALAKAGHGEEVGREVIRLIDRKDKINDFEAQLAAIAPGFELDATEPTDVREVRERLEALGVDNVRFDPYLARGFDYYTGVVFEVFALDPENRRALFGGGRYDGLTKHFGAPEIPAVGFGMGDVTAIDLLATLNKTPAYKPASELHVIVADDSARTTVLAAAETWRTAGINVSVDLSGRKVGDQIRYADKLAVPCVCVIGSSEIESNEVEVKRLSDGATHVGSFEAVPDAVRELLN